MENILFITGIFAFLWLLFYWGFSYLPMEKWQVLAAIPYKKNKKGSWDSITFTYYGLLSAFSYIFALSIFIILIGSVSIPLILTLIYIIPILLICVPASKLVAMIVEKKSSTFTVGGAVFIGVIIGPWLIMGISEFLKNYHNTSVNNMAVLAAMAIAYAFGESLGRLACLSFGCCYGKELSKCSPIIQAIFNNNYFVFYGNNKKAAYEENLEGVELVPIQGITSIIYGITGILCSYLFMEKYYSVAAVTALVVTQGWRLLSEFLRADYRGGGKISAYQIMGIIGVIYSCLIIPFIPVQTGLDPNLLTGLKALYSIEAILFLQFVGLFIFIFTGKSKVIESRMTYQVLKNRT